MFICAERREKSRFLAQSQQAKRLIYMFQTSALVQFRKFWNISLWLCKVSKDKDLGFLFVCFLRKAQSLLNWYIGYLYLVW